MDIDRHIAAIDEAGGRLAAAAEQVALDAPVPSCPDWDVRELVRHQGGIHRWATSIVATPRREFWNVDLPEVVGAWPADDALVPWFREGCAALVDALRAAPDGLECWTFLEAPSPKAMWARRQAHETTVHAVDAELAGAGGVSAIAPDVAADGIDELVACFITRRGSKLRSDPARTLGIRATDVDDGWTVTIGPDGPATVRALDTAADCTVTGAAADLYLALWNRADPTPLTVTGDRTVFDGFLDTVHVRWS